MPRGLGLPTGRYDAGMTTRHGASLRVDRVSNHFGSEQILHEVSLDIPPGTVCALLGPSGSGKTTLLRLIAGLETPTSGTIELADRVLSGPRTFVAPEKRRVGMVFQDWALFPHLSVTDNVAFGLDRSERRTARVAEVLKMVGLAGFADRLPGTLSGGQQQRVALARALAPRPEMLLLDEPFSNLDVTLRVQVRTEVHRLLADAGITAVFVTHDQEEAFVLGDLVAVMRDGRILQVDEPSNLYADPIDPWVASFVGDANLLPAASTNGATAGTSIGPVTLSSAPAAVNGTIVLVRPEHVALTPGDDGTVELVEYYGHDCMVIARLDDGTLIRSRAPFTNLERDDRVSASYRGPATMSYPHG